MSDLQQKVDTLNALLFEIRGYKEQHPEERLGYYLSIPSLLNAYREGDIDFDNCVAEIEKVCGEALQKENAELAARLEAAERDSTRLGQAVDSLLALNKSTLDQIQEWAEVYRSKLTEQTADLQQRLAAAEQRVVDMLLFCPQCGEQHIDLARPDVCETCGKDEENCECDTYTAWLNPPHKSHRCCFCNHVWRPADAPTNGVLAINSKGERDGNPRPRYFYTAKDYNDALAAAEQKAQEARREAFEKAIAVVKETAAPTEDAHAMRGEILAALEAAAGEVR